MAAAPHNAYSLIVLNSVLNNPQGFIRTITSEAVGWRRSIRDNIGCMTGTFKMYGTEGFLADVFGQWLGYDVQERSGGVVSWRGMIYEIDLVHDGVRRRRSLDSFSNYISTTYIDPAGNIQTSSAASSARSITRYGRKEEILLQDNIPQHSAEAMRDRVLTARGWPKPEAVSIGAPGDSYVEVMVCGYGFTANWRFVTEKTEPDALVFAWAGTRFDNIGADPAIVLTDQNGLLAQDFSEWQSLAAPALYSVWVTAGGVTYWGYCGAADTESVANDSIHVYQDQALTTEGWNGGVPVTTLKVDGYYVRGPASSWISDIVTTDCEFLTVGAIDSNPLQVNRMLTNNMRCWDVIQDLTDLGDTGGDPWHCWVDTQNLVHYRQIDTTPRYYVRAGGVYDSIGGRVTVNPWLCQPGVIRDMSSPVKRTEYDGWLLDVRDVYAEEVEVTAGASVPTFKTAIYDESSIMSATLQHLWGINGPEDRMRGILPQPDNGNRGGWDVFPQPGGGPGHRPGEKRYNEGPPPGTPGLPGYKPK